MQLPFTIVQSLVSSDSIPRAIAFVTFSQLGALSLILSVINAVFLNEAGNHIARANSTLSKSTINSILSGIGSTTFNQLDQRIQHQILGFIVADLGKGYIVAISSGALALSLSCCLLLPRFRNREKVTG